MTKKLLLLLTAFLLFPALASASFQNPAPPPDTFKTNEYRALQEFYQVQRDLRETPVFEQDRESIKNQGKLIHSSATKSFNQVYQQEQLLLEAAYKKEVALINNEAKNRITAGEQKITAWYKKNKNKPGAKKIAKARSLKLVKDVSNWKAIAITKALSLNMVNKSRLAIGYQAALRNADNIYTVLLNTIDERPSLDG